MMHLPKNRLGGFTLIEMVVTLGVLAVLASLAIPAFTRYMRKSKTAEVYESLDKLSLGAQGYFHAEHMDPDGFPWPRQFPDLGDVGRTPAAACCTQPAGQCADTNWGPFVELTFGIDSKTHFYQYQFESGGSEDTARFTATAFGDLDCDDIESTFHREGRSTNIDGDLDVGPVVPVNEIE
jgi:prepilin-type N-terminal cleavage/methylation domain-containing protein